MEGMEQSQDSDEAVYEEEESQFLSSQLHRGENAISQEVAEQKSKVQELVPEIEQT